MPKTPLPKKRRLLLTILLVLLAATIATIAWILWTQNSEVRQSTQDQNTNTNQLKPIEDENNEPAETVETNPYLVIEEWGVRITLPEHLRGDISYYINDRIYQDFGVIRLDLVSRVFSEGNLKCADIETDPRGIVAIERQIDGQGGVTIDPQPFNSIGNSRFYFVQTGCEEAINRSGSEQDKQLVRDIKQAVKDTLEEAR